MSFDLKDMQGLDDFKKVIFRSIFTFEFLWKKLPKVKV